MNEAPPFVAFGPAHWATLAVVFAAAFGVPLALRRFGSERARRGTALAIAATLVLHEATKIGVRVGVYDHRLAEHLPLHLCGAALVLNAIVLWRRHQGLYEIAYFWAATGTVAALLTPDLPFGFPHPFFLVFYFGHGLVILATLYATFVYGFRPRPRSIPKAVAVTLAYMAAVAPLNVALEANYLYLRHKPTQPSPMDAMGPWPWYIGGLILSGIVAFCLAYVPFAVADRLARRRSNATGPR